jgi:(p)ppGpp synthase/HD superfamily hydrolase
MECDSLDTINTKKLLEAHWKGEKATPYTVSFQVSSDKKIWVLLQLLRVVERFGLSIWSLQSTENNEWNKLDISFEILFSNPSTVWYFVERILEKPFFKTVETSFASQW